MTSLFENLKRKSGALWLEAQQHQFVDALADGSLPREKFIHYLKQDYVYLIGYARSWALAAAKAPELELLHAASELVNSTLNLEMDLHRSCCAEFGIAREELDREHASPICRSYVDFCVATAATGDFVDLLCALIPCGVGYAEIGNRLAAGLTEGQVHPYRRWIETYSSPEFTGYAQWMTDTLDGLQSSVGDSRLPRLQQLFDLGCRFEWLFWEMGWKQDEWPL